MSKLYHKVTNKIKKKDKRNDTIGYKSKFDNKFSLSRGTKDPLPVVTSSLQGGKKQRSNIISILTYLWYSRSTDSVIKMRHTKPYKSNICSNKV